MARKELWILGVGKLGKALRDGNISFVSVPSPTSYNTHHFPVAFRLWAFARLKDILKNVDLEAPQKPYSSGLHPCTKCGCATWKSLVLIHVYLACMSC